MVSQLTDVQRLKLEVMSRGVRVADDAKQLLRGTDNARRTVADYPTTGGLSLVLPGGVYVNAPVDEWCCEATATLSVSAEHQVLRLTGSSASVEVACLPVPAFLESGLGPSQGVMTHADRVRISPIAGCACTCAFCDARQNPYMLRPADDLSRYLRAATSDARLPARHALISGGTPRKEDRSRLDDLFVEVIAESPVPVDVMLMPRDTTGIVDTLFSAGVDGLSINLELFDQAFAEKYCPEKARSRSDFERCLTRAVELTGGRGRVRSMLLFGIEPPEATLKGVELIASLGADPVLSPLRPAQGTPFADARPPSVESMADLYVAARSVADRHGVKLGPRCVPCQHNTLAFPDGSGAYFTYGFDGEKVFEESAPFGEPYGAESVTSGDEQTGVTGSSDPTIR